MQPNRIIRALGQESTWRGAILLIGAVAIVLRPDEIEKIVPAVLALVGAINVMKDK